MNKNIYLGIAILAIGLFALPNVLSVYTGSHTWGDPKDNGIQCERCHQTIYDEMRAQSYSTHTPHAFMDDYGEIRYFECLECHTIEYDIEERFRNGVIGDEEPGHTVTTTDCMACHGDVPNGEEMHDLGEKYGMVFSWADITNPNSYCHKCHDIDLEGGNGFDINAFICNIDVELMQDAHGNFYNDVLVETGSANKACLGCHSNIDINITWNETDTLSMTVDELGTHII